MRAGTVMGRLWATKHIDRLPSGALLTIELEGRDGAHIVAFDPLGCGEGERVLVVEGSTASKFFVDRGAMVDAVIVGIVDPDKPAST